MDERRRSQRHDAKKGVKGKLRPSLEVRVINISEHGILIESPMGLPPAGVCELTVEAPSGEKMVRAKVARCRAQMVKGPHGKPSMLFHAGLEFFEEDAEGLDIKNLISEICVIKAPTEPGSGAFEGIEQAV